MEKQRLLKISRFQSHELDVIDFVLVFNKDNKNKEARNKYLSNLMVNGLELQIKVKNLLEKINK